MQENKFMFKQQCIRYKVFNRSAIISLQIQNISHFFLGWFSGIEKNRQFKIQSESKPTHRIESCKYSQSV